MKYLFLFIFLLTNTNTNAFADSNWLDSALGKYSVANSDHIVSHYKKTFVIERKEVWDYVWNGTNHEWQMTGTDYFISLRLSENSDNSLLAAKISYNLQGSVTYMSPTLKVDESSKSIAISDYWATQPGGAEALMEKYTFVQVNGNFVGTDDYYNESGTQVIYTLSESFVRE